jgi:multidrug efflux pump subunit AcrA (membrane-fusion protein)
MSNSIFRQEALERLGSPEQLDQLMPLTSLRGWVALGGAGFLLLVALLWGVFGTIETRVEGDGVLFRPAGIKVLEAPEAGVATGIAVEVGADVGRGQLLLRLTPAPGDTSPTVPVVSPGPARVLDLAVGEGEGVAKGAPLVTLEFPDRPLQAMLYVPLGEGQAVRPGLEVQLSPPAAAGRVKSIARLPASRAALLRTLRNEEQVNALLRAGPCLEVVVELAPPPGPGDAGAATRDLSSGTPCRGRITVGTRRPVTLVFPAVRHLLGG